MANNPYGTITLSTKTEDELLAFVKDLVKPSRLEYRINSVDDFIDKISKLCDVYDEAYIDVPILTKIDILGVERASQTSILLWVRTRWIENMLTWSHEIISKYPYLSLSGGSNDFYGGLKYKFKDGRVLQVVEELNPNTDNTKKSKHIDGLKIADDTLYTFNIVGSDESCFLDYCKEIAIADGLSGVASVRGLVDKLNALIIANPQKCVNSSVVGSCRLRYISCLADSIIEVKFTATTDEVFNWSNSLLNNHLSLSLFGYAPSVENGNANLLILKSVRGLDVDDEELDVDNEENSGESNESVSDDSLPF